MPSSTTIVQLFTMPICSRVFGLVGLLHIPVEAGLDPLPLSTSILEPDFDLHFAQIQQPRDVGALVQREILLGYELFLKL